MNETQGPQGSPDIRLATPEWSSELSLNDYLGLLRRHFWLVLAIFAAVVTGAVVFTANQDPMYEAEAEVLLRTGANQTLFPVVTGSGSTLIIRNTQSELEFLAGDQYISRAQTAADTNLVVATHNDTENRSNVLMFTAQSVEPEEAARAAQAWAETYISYRHELAVSETATALEAARQAISELTVELDDLREPLNRIDTEIADEEDTIRLSQLVQIRLALQQSLEVELGPVESQIWILNEQISSLELSSRALGNSGISARLVRGAQEPSSPISPSLPRNLALAVVVGAILSIAVVLLTNTVRGRLGSAEEFENATGRPVVARVPKVRRLKAEIPIEAVVRPQSLATEAYRTLVTALEFDSMRRPVRTVLVTSANSSEGKSTVSANLGALIGQHNTRVLLVGADLRRPTLHTLFGLTNEVGLTTYLAGHTTMDESIVEVRMDGIRLSVMQAGPSVQDPAEALRSVQATELFAKLAADYDLVIIDGAPVLPVTDSVVLSRLADSVILIGMANETRRRDATLAMETLRAAGASVTGLVFNKVKSSNGYTY
ncbi:MAG: polysaccharide biosynthesis tyrosine autokinase, partial [Actinomycetia bacterium]|nr:polysaccharide biosynthesis tyrosine autokinase [Actinomycetes bacterium]